MLDDTRKLIRHAKAHHTEVKRKLCEEPVQENVGGNPLFAVARNNISSNQKKRTAQESRRGPGYLGPPAFLDATCMAIFDPVL